MERNRHSSTIGVKVDSMRPVRAIENKSVSRQSGNQLTSCEISEERPVEGRQLNIDRNVRFDDRFWTAHRLFGNVVTMLDHTFYDHPNNRVDVIQRFGFGRAPS